MDLYRTLISQAKGPSITMFVGENGTGKSRSISGLATELLHDNKRVIAISNTVFDRFPRGRHAGYTRLSPTIGSSYATRVFKRALLDGQRETPRNSELIARSLEYVGFEPTIGVSVRFRRQFDPLEFERLNRVTFDRNELADIMRAFKIYQADGRSAQLAWVNLYGSEFLADDRRELLNILKYESALRKAKIIYGVSLSLARGTSVYPLVRASSGEVSLLATYACLATHASEGVSVLIDEPENSLHPKWQREYCNRLLDQFYQYSPQIVIATHSPQIVQGAEGTGVSTHIVKLPEYETVSTPVTKSIEGTLVEAFGLLSPANHYLSEKVTYLLNELVQRRADLSSTTYALSSLKDLSTDSDQIDFLEKTSELASKITEKLSEGGRP